MGLIKGQLELLRAFLISFVVFGFSCCTGTDTGNPITNGGYSDETETVAKGIVRDSIGKPVEACSVWVHRIAAPKVSALSKTQLQVDSTQKSFVRVTDSSGAFVFLDLPEGSYSLIAIQKERGIGTRTQFALHARDTLELLDSAHLRHVEQLIVAVKNYDGDTILIPELGIEWPVISDTLKVLGIPAGSYSIYSKNTGSLIETRSTQTIMQGPVLTWNADKTQATFTDPRDNSIYNVIISANLVWMASNLRFPSANSVCNANDPTFDAGCSGYGRFYTFAEAQSSCPIGWHLPTQDEWMGLIYYVGGISYAGLAFKSTTGWDSFGGSNGTNEIGINVLPAGSAKFPAIGTEAYFWTYSGSTPLAVNFSAGSNEAVIGAFTEGDMLTVRCVIAIK